MLNTGPQSDKNLSCDDVDCEEGANKKGVRIRQKGELGFDTRHLGSSLMKEAISLMKDAISLMKEAIRLMKEAIRLMKEAISLIAITALPWRRRQSA